MRKLLPIWIVCVCVLVMAAVSIAGDLPPTDKVPAYLQSISVTIKADRSEGSGVSFYRDGETFIWTAGHVVDGLRHTRKVINSDGTTRTIVEFDDAKVLKQVLEDNRLVGRLEMDAEVIRYSDSDTGEDLALLRVRKKGFITDSVFYDGPATPLGTKLLHVGSLLGESGANSMTSGIMSQHGRLIGKVVFHQVTTPAFPGSSGGGVFLEDGQWIGMLVRGAGETFCIVVPVERLRRWAKDAGVLWAVDKEVPMPSDDEMKKLPIEDIGVTFASKDAAHRTGTRFMIRRLE